MSRSGLALLLLLPLGGCSLVVGSATSRLADDLSTGILEQDDVETVRDGAPAYLLMLDGLIAGDPDNEALLLAGSRLYGAYASAFVEDPDRAGRLTDRSLRYARTALCHADATLCAALDRPYDELEVALPKSSADVTVLYGFGSAWAGWIQAHSADWNAVAEIPKVELLMERVLELDAEHEAGGPDLYLGVLLTQRPASLGGRPEEARAHFERARELSEGRNLMVPVFYARSYARLVFDRELHDRLLAEALEADPQAPGLTLTNTLAQEQARELLAGADDYF
jgi:hypothetical protein